MHENHLASPCHPCLVFLGFSKQEYWNGLPFPSPGDLLDPGIKPESPASPALARGCFTAEPPGKPKVIPGHQQASPRPKARQRSLPHPPAGFTARLGARATHQRTNHRSPTIREGRRQPYGGAPEHVTRRPASVCSMAPHSSTLAWKISWRDEGSMLL